MKQVLLVVDDHRVSRLLPRFVLQPFADQIQVLECERGSDALHLLEAEQVSHVLLDISMPDLDGIEVAKTINEIFKSHSGFKANSFSAKPMRLCISAAGTNCPEVFVTSIVIVGGLFAMLAWLHQTCRRP